MDFRYVIESRDSPGHSPVHVTADGHRALTVYECRSMAVEAIDGSSLYAKPIGLDEFSAWVEHYMFIKQATHVLIVREDRSEVLVQIRDYRNH